MLRLTSLRHFNTSRILLGQVVPYLLADIGEGILQVEVMEWYVKPGDTVKQFQNLCEVQSDKASTPISSRYNGIIRKLYVETNGIAKVGQPIVDIETDDAIAASAGVKAKPAAPVAAATTTTANKTTSSTVTEETKSTEKKPAAAAVLVGNGGKALCPPSVRRIAAENNIDLATVPATGKGGRVVTKEDILNFIQNGGAAAAVTTTTTSSSTTTTSSSSRREDKTIKITGVKRIMVQSMTKANQIPAFGSSDEIEISNLIKVRDMLRPSFAKRYQQTLSMEEAKISKPMKLSFMPFFLKAASLALSQYPDINAHTNDDCTAVTIKGSHNIGFAMDSPQGLIVPVVHNVQDKGLFELAVDLQGLIERTVKGTVGIADLQGATFSLSNIGSIGATYSKPVINPPQVAIGALGRGRLLPRFDKDGKVFPATIVEVSWSADHRVIDGATMVRFSNVFKDFLENPETMLGYMK